MNLTTIPIHILCLKNNYSKYVIPLDKNPFYAQNRTSKPNNMRHLYLFLIFAFVLFSCKKDNGSSAKETQYSISGVAQKGPFTQGSKVTVYELNSNFEQTGKVFSTETSDDYGSFSLKDMLLTSTIVQVEVQGSSYNEIYAGFTMEEMTLSNIVDLKKGITINVNLLSDLSRQRFKYLVQNGSSFDQAKIQAEKEVMKAFGLDSFYVTSSENMDITKPDDASGSLLALSAIFLTVRDQQYTLLLQQLAAKYRSDFETDGILSDTSLINYIQQALYVVNPGKITNSLSTYYKMEIPSFSKYIDIAKKRFPIINPPSGSTDIIISNIVGNLLILPRDTNYLPDSTYTIDFSFPARTYKKIRLTISNLGNQRWSLWGGNLEYISSSNGQVVYELQGVGLASHSYFLNDNLGVLYFVLEDITNSQSQIVVQKWIGFNHP